MTATERQIESQIRALFAAEGRDLTLEIAGASTYDPETGITTTVTSGTLTVKGKLYLKNARQQEPGSQNWVTVQQQKCVIEARGLTETPKQNDIITDGETRYAIREVMPQGDPALTYEMILDKA